MKHIWKSFFALKDRQHFYITRTKLAVKVGFCSYQRHADEATLETWGKQTPVERIAPWRRVRTTEPVKSKHPIRGRVINTQDATQMEIAAGKYWPRAKDCLSQETAQTGCAHESALLPENYPWKFSAVDGPTEGQLRDPMVQDHTPDNPRTHDRTL